MPAAPSVLYLNQRVAMYIVISKPKRMSV